MTAALVQFLRARFDEEVAEAGKLDDGDDWEMEPWQVRRDETGTWDSYAYLRIAKARVLAEIDAKRRILAMHEEAIRVEQFVLKEAIRAFAAVYNTHPDYLPEWAPDQA
jgi:hypothetical protein